MFTKRFIFTLIFLISLFISNLGTTSVHAASIIVNTNADSIANDGFCTLREAITNANNNSQLYPSPGECGTGVGTDTITFAGNYTITLVGAELPVVTSAMIIKGNGAVNTIIQANASANTATYRVLAMSGSDAILTLDSLTVRHGRCTAVCDYGGGIYKGANASLTLVNSTVSNNSSSSGSGGGIYNGADGGLTIINSTISGNSANDYGGAIYNSTASISNITNSTITGNNATNSGGGIYSAQSSLTLTNSTLSNNSVANDSGGAIYIALGTLNITNGIFSGNSSTSAGGAIFNNGTSTVTDSTFSGNSSSYGGAIYNNNTLNVINSTLSENNAGEGGGIYNGNIYGVSNLGVYNSTISGNDTGTGGGIYNRTNSNLWLGNTTVSGNEAYDYGGGIYSDGSAWLHNSTIAFNTLVEGTNSGAAGIDGNVALYNTLVAGNLRLISSEYRDCSGTMYTEGYNLFLNLTNCTIVVNSGSNNYLNNLSLLGPLQNNGGPTWTHALLSGSNAIDTGNNTLCTNWPIDNLDGRGLTRPQGSQCDVGAYEKMAGTFPTFADVPTNAFAWAQIESIFKAGITGGCGSGNYCPLGTVTRAQMAVFLMKGINGSSYSPPPATGTMFNDVPVNSFAATFIEAFATQGITGGCGGGNFCPSGLVTRAQMAVFLLKAKHGSSYAPPSATGTMFSDVPSNAFAAAWIEQLAKEGITGGCGNGNFCPNASVTRGQMAVFLQKTFYLPLP